MRVEFSKEFEKAVRKLSGKMLDSVRQAVQEVINAENIEELTDCKKLVDYEFIYRLRIGSYRAFFSYHVQIVARRLAYGCIFGDILMKCVYRMRPYEIKKGSTDRLHRKWEKICSRKMYNNFFMTMQS